MQKISFVVSGLTLRGTIFYPEKMRDKNPAVYFLHGWGSSENNISVIGASFGAYLATLVTHEV